MVLLLTNTWYSVSKKRESFCMEMQYAVLNLSVYGYVVCLPVCTLSLSVHVGVFGTDDSLRSRKRQRPLSKTTLN